MWRKQRPYARIAVSKALIPANLYACKAISIPCPIVPCEIVMDDGRSHRIRLPDRDNANLFSHLTDWKWLSSMIPALAETLESMFGGTVHLEAKLPEHIMRMIEEGKLHFLTDKNGEILAEVFDERNKIYKQVRLEEVVVNDALLPSLQHLETQAAIAMALAKIDQVDRAVRQLGEEIQQDRLARVDAAFDMFHQACYIEGIRDRNEYLREALNEATRAKASLVRNFMQQERLLKKGGTKKSDAALRAVQDLVAITNAVNVQTQSHAVLGEQAAAMYCLRDFSRFIETHNLNDEDTLLKLVGSVQHQNRPNDLADKSYRFRRASKNVVSSFELGETVSPKLIVGSADAKEHSTGKENMQDEEEKA